MSFDRLAKNMSNDMKKDLKASINQISTPANKPETVEAKGSSNPLIDSGLMMRSIDNKQKSKTKIPFSLMKGSKKTVRR